MRSGRIESNRTRNERTVNDEVGVFIAFTAGIFSSSLRVLFLVPSYLTFVTGMSLEDIGGVDRKTLCAFTTLCCWFQFGLHHAGCVHASGRFSRLWCGCSIGGVVIVLLGIHLAGVLRMTSLLREKRLHLNDKPAGYLGTLGVGVAFGAGWTPCIGPALGAILTYGMAQETMWAGVGLLTVYSLGLAIPFLLASLALDWFLQTFQKFRAWIPVVEKASGVLLILLGILLLTGQFTLLASWLSQYTPAWILERV